MHRPHPDALPSPPLAPLPARAHLLCAAQAHELDGQQTLVPLQSIHLAAHAAVRTQLRGAQ